ncbi:unnamed protein product [Schistosoma margrebowiei]|uniref:Uncharacterized protein n=1 Tax=Schistosoma margrebowiei TaxID=48269 RepID=A0AA84ZEB8_9TREM|nr:unnamed protein product [Schistosoma margrebowiei]
MLSKSSTFHVSTRHVYEHELKHLQYHQNQNHRSQQQSEVDDPTPHSNQYTKHNQRQVLNSNMSRSEIMFNSKVSRSLHIDVNTITNNNVSSISPTNSSFTTSSNDNHIACELNDISDIDEEIMDDNDSDNDIDDDSFYNKDEVDELFFFIPTVSSNEVKYGNQLKQHQSIPFTQNTNHIHKLYDDSFNLQVSPKLPSLKERITRTQNIWCLPNLSRIESEKLLEFAEIGKKEKLTLYETFNCISKISRLNTYYIYK